MTLPTWIFWGTSSEMTISLTELALYSGALAILFLTPGPVWVGLIARALSGGFAAAWPLTLGVVIGDVLWSLLAILGLAWLVDQYPGTLGALKWLACATFLTLGYMILKNADKDLASGDSRLTRPGFWGGFAAGLLVILGNPKAIVFYGGMLPGFFDLTALTGTDITLIVIASAVVPLLGNLMLAAFVNRVRRLLKTPTAVRRMNLTAGWLLVLVGVIIPFT